MPFTRLIAVVLLLATTGCAATPLFSRKDEDDGPLDPRSSAGKSLKDAETASAMNGQWNVIRDADQTADAAVPVRPPVQLPVSELVARAEAAVAQQRLPQAKQHCEAILLQQPTNPRAHHLLARISDDEGQWGNAEHHYQLALQTDPNNADIVNDLGYCYLMQGRLPLAQQCLQQALQLNPTHQVAAGNLADLYSRRGDMQSAYRVLSTVLPPPDVERTLAQLFPGAPLHETMNPAPTVPPQVVANGQQFADASPYPPQLPSASTNPAEHDAPVNAVPGFTSSMPIIPPSTNAVPTYVAQADPSAMQPPAVGAPYQYPQSIPTAQHPATIEQTVAHGMVAPGTTSSPVATTASTGPRRWPPAIWPPESNESPVTQAAGVSPSSSPHSSSGVTYLLPRRPQTSPNAPVSPFTPAGLPPANALPQSETSNPPRPLPNGTVSQFDNPAQYASGPGASRIVTWSNQNGQSLESPPLPPTDKELRAAAAMGLNGAAVPPTAVMRTSPGSDSGWNGGFYPPPQRQLPGSTGSIYDYPQQGAPLRATAPGTAGTAASASANEPHAGFVIAPNTALPANPLSGFEADRRQFDRQFQQQIDQSYAQSPSGYIRPPAESIPVPTYEIPAQSQPAMTGPPLTPNGTPWPGRSADGTVPQANTTNSSPQAAAIGLVAPQPYRSQRTSAPPVTPPAYNRPAQPAASTDPFDAAGPMIIPGPSSW